MCVIVIKLSMYVTNFAMKDVEYFEKIFDECERMYVRGGDKKRKAEYEILCKIKKVLIEETRMIRFTFFWLTLLIFLISGMVIGTRQT